MEDFMVKNIVFDIGAVLVGYNPKEYAKKINISLEKVDKAHEVLVHTKGWREYLDGKIENEEFLKDLIQKNPEYKDEFELLILKENNKHITYEIKENTQLLKELSNNYNIYLLSNITKDTMDSFKEMYDFEKKITGATYSYEAHISKPHKEIYNFLFSKYNLKPNECIFIDDKLHNIEVANELGMQGIHYTDHEKLVEELGGKLK
jgi:epoxide hydrolase-like predicted phosphatase